MASSQQSKRKKKEHVSIEYESLGQKAISAAPQILEPARKHFKEVALLPSPGDNAAICSYKIPQGTTIIMEEGGKTIEFQLGNTILEGHRFTIRDVKKGEKLLSWGLPFGVAITDIPRGNYICNESIISTLRIRNLNIDLPTHPNFEDYIEPCSLETNKYYVGTQVEKYSNPGSWMGFDRRSRGAGTRNFIVLLGISSTTASFVRVLERKLLEQIDLKFFGNVSGITSVSHTEGGEDVPGLNQEFVLRTLSGFIVHPNVAAILIVDSGIKNAGVLKGKDIENFMGQRNYPTEALEKEFFSLSGDFNADLERAQDIVKLWVPAVNSIERTKLPLSKLKIALQCGGSDAFSGISGNPLAGWAARELIKHGGAALLAETDELIGAETYIISNVKSREVAEKFLGMVSFFRNLTGLHGHSAEGNPSGGNKFRGLYNIALKSLGAGMKKPKDVRLDGVVDYSELMPEDGYYFMNSPGNDLESIAGQVATGCQIIYFTTGNGSITNFPFVPTIKIVTTTTRFKLLEKDMDFNAGAYQDGTPMEELGKNLFAMTLGVANGQLTKGENAHHSQVSIWRNWHLSSSVNLEEIQKELVLRDGVPVQVGKKQQQTKDFSNLSFDGLLGEDGQVKIDQVGLILPTSLCSGQIARMIADNLNASNKSKVISRFVSLPHTEGCGASGGTTEEIYRRTVVGHLLNPLVKFGLLLEHGCEKTHNDYMIDYLKSVKVDPNSFGWASVQLDGGIESVCKKVQKWFENKVADNPTVKQVNGKLSDLKIGIMMTPSSSTSDELVRCITDVTQAIVFAGGTVVIPSTSTLLQNNLFVGALVDDGSGNHTVIKPSIAFAQIPSRNGLHIMHTPTRHWVETLTGLASCGVECIISIVEEEFLSKSLQAHPLVPVIQIATNSVADQCCGLGEKSKPSDYDLILGSNPDQWPSQVFDILLRVASRKYVPKMMQLGNFDFQIPRGPLGVSM